jgi:short-subunit dehydrogenase
MKSLRSAAVCRLSAALLHDRCMRAYRRRPLHRCLGQVNKYFHPFLLRSRGRVVNISSEVALPPLSAAFCAPYTMSKVAIEAYSTALRQELGMLGIKVWTSATAAQLPTSATHTQCSELTLLPNRTPPLAVSNPAVCASCLPPGTSASR